MEDCLHRGVLGDAGVRFAYTATTGLANEAVLAHDCDPVSAHILCRALTAGVLMSPLLVDDERYTLRWQYGGALASAVVDVDSSGQVRGLRPDCDLERFERIRRRLAGAACRDLLSGAPADDRQAEHVASALAGDETPAAAFSLVECEPPCFHCHCTRERMLDVVRALPEQERRATVEKGEDVTVRCQFCAAAHTIGTSELADAAQGGG